MGLVPIVRKAPAQLFAVEFIEQVGCGGSRISHPHVEGRTGPETEPARSLIELVRRNAQVQEDEVRPEPADGLERDRIAVGGEEVFDTAAEQYAGGGQRLRSAVDSHHRGSRLT